MIQPSPTDDPIIIVRWFNHPRLMIQPSRDDPAIIWLRWSCHELIQSSSWENPAIVRWSFNGFCWSKTVFVRKSNRRREMIQPCSIEYPTIVVRWFNHVRLDIDPGIARRSSHREMMQPSSFIVSKIKPSCREMTIQSSSCENPTIVRRSNHRPSHREKIQAIIVRWRFN